MDKKRIIILAGKGESSNILYNALAQEFNIYKMIIEEPVQRSVFIKKRIKKLGVAKVIGQLLFMSIALPFIQIEARKRVIELKKQNRFNNQLPDSKNIINVDTVNSDYTISILSDARPDLIIVNGTRIISKKVLKSVNCPFINTHVGITPKYRGVHGGYWALVNDDFRNCGVTIHFIDAGIDTGNIISQALISPTKRDNFATYPFLQLAAGIHLIKEATNDFFSNKIIIKKNNLESRLWTHPTLYEYLKYRFTIKVK